MSGASISSKKGKRVKCGQEISDVVLIGTDGLISRQTGCCLDVFTGWEVSIMSNKFFLLGYFTSFSSLFCSLRTTEILTLLAARLLVGSCV